MAHWSRLHCVFVYTQTSEEKKQKTKSQLVYLWYEDRGVTNRTTHPERDQYLLLLLCDSKCDGPNRSDENETDKILKFWSQDESVVLLMLLSTYTVTSFTIFLCVVGGIDCAR